MGKTNNTDTMWALNGNTLSLNTSANNVYSFGFSGFNSPQGKPIYDEFDMYVWEQRKAAGFDEPMPTPVGYEPTTWDTYANWGGLSGQTILTSTLTITTPKHYGQIYGFTTGPTDDSNK